MEYKKQKKGDIIPQFTGLKQLDNGAVILTGGDYIEYLVYKQQHLMNTDEEFWDFSIEDLTNGSIEPSKEYAYAEFVLENGETRYFETNISKVGAILGYAVTLNS